MVFVVDGTTEEDADGNVTAAVEVGGVVTVMVDEVEVDGAADADADNEVKVVGRVGIEAAVVATVSMMLLSVVETGVVVTAAGVAGLPPCGQMHHAAQMAPHSTNTAAVADNHRIGRCLGVGMTRFSVSVVIQRGQKRAFDTNVAPQCGHVFIPVLPQRF